MALFWLLEDSIFSMGILVKNQHCKCFQYSFLSCYHGQHACAILCEPYSMHSSFTSPAIKSWGKKTGREVNKTPFSETLYYAFVGLRSAQNTKAIWYQHLVLWRHYPDFPSSFRSIQAITTIIGLFGFQSLLRLSVQRALSDLMEL